MRGKDKKPVEYHIQEAHANVQQAGNVHIAATAQHTAAERVELRKGQTQTVAHKV